MKIAAWALGLLACGCASRELPVYGTLPDFSLIDQDGAPFGAPQLKGSVWLADFIYTSCPGPCPALSAQMARLQKSLPDDVRLVSVSVDPESDRPAVLKDYAERFHADERRWRFLTGKRGDVFTLVSEGFKLALVPTEKGLVTHSTKIALVDQDLRLRGYYDGDDAAALRRLEKDAAGLAR